jgi:broad specificity phosphatase PhoE
MTIELVYETHSASVDNERGIASGWSDCLLSDLGRDQAKELGRRRRDDAIAAVFASDLRRAHATATIAFGDTGIPLFLDWRLRECDYGSLNGSPAADLKRRLTEYIDTPYPDGESWRQAVARVRRFLDDLPARWDGKRVVVIGHMATRWAFEHLLNDVPLETLAAEEFVWQPGWEYRLG